MTGELSSSRQLTVSQSENRPLAPNRSPTGGREQVPVPSTQSVDRFRELTALTVLLQEQEKAMTARERTVLWLCEVAALLFEQPAWWGIMPASWRAKRQRRLLRKRGIFDGDAYLRQNPDLAGAKIDPLLHYLLHGLAEGRPRPQ